MIRPSKKRPSTYLIFYESLRTIGSPQILELSGIGRPDVLQNIGVDVQVDLPGVGENVQEHVGIDMVFELDPKGGHETLDLLADPAYAAKSKKLQLSF